MRENFEQDVVALMPTLRRFAQKLSRDPVEAEELTQIAVERAILYRKRFQPGTNLRAWLFTILRNAFLNEQRRQTTRRSVIDGDSDVEGRATTAAADDVVYIREIGAAITSLPDHQRDALTLVAVLGHEYEDVAKVTGVAPGTVKSRVHRARASLRAAIDPTPLGESEARAA